MTGEAAGVLFRGAAAPPDDPGAPGDTLVLDYTNALSTSGGPPLDMTNICTRMGCLIRPSGPATKSA
jgi:hypothetical protein